MSTFGDIERVAADLYPYRWPITAGLMLALGAGVWAAFRLGWQRWVWRHRLLAGIAGALALAVILPAGWYTLSPLWERSRLEEASPLAASAAAMPGATTGATDLSPGIAASPPAAFEARVTRRGMFQGADDFHFGRGDALLIETEPGRYTLRFENFSVRNGPDLFVYLTGDPGSVDGAVNLGGLKATDGNLNYHVPEGIDVSQYRYAIVWCRQFTVLFASAPLEAV